MNTPMLIALSMLLLSSIGASCAYGFSLESGACDYQVFQRGDDGKANLALSGAAGAHDGSIQARLVVQATAEPVPGFGWKQIASANAGGTWEGALAGVPAGGEYRLQLRLVDRQGNVKRSAPDVDHLLVGDLWVMTGQSNMIGRGKLGPDREKGIPEVHVFDCDYRWRQAEEPVTGKVTDRLILGGNWERDFGQHSSCLRFAKDVYAATGVPIGIVPAAIGGTTLAHWAKPAAPHESGALSLYERTLKMVEGAGGRVAGMLWWQGEGEFGGDPQQYLVPFKKLIADFREDLGSPDLPFIFAQLESTDATPPDQTRQERWTNKQESFRLAELQIPHTAMIVTIDQPRMDVHHLDTPALKIVGSRFALAARALVYGQDIPWSGPRFESAAFTDKSRLKVRVLFSGLDREVRPQAGIKGFQVVGPEGPVAIESAARDEKKPAAVLLTLSRLAPKASRVRYGFGRNPEVNLTDAAGLPAGVFAAQPVH